MDSSNIEIHQLHIESYYTTRGLHKLKWTYIPIILCISHQQQLIYSNHDDVIKWKLFPRYWPFVRGIHRSPANSPHKGQRRVTLMFSLICALNKRLSKQSWGWWFETPSGSFWRQCNVTIRWMHIYLMDAYWFWQNKGGQSGPSPCSLICAITNLMPVSH